jgi:EAL domain-containing protein (putative c-di-GMP-specific phosphodiesterase class I)
MAVNVSSQQFHHEGFVDDVARALAVNEVPADRLKLELTESLLVDDLDTTIATMTTLRTLGVRFSLDDFGTGYSSLSYLKRMPLDQIKIDQSFVRDLFSDPNDAAIINTIIALGQTLGLEVIAEGVETAEQHLLLVKAGCPAFQGYLFSKPTLNNFRRWAVAVDKWPLVPAIHTDLSTGLQGAAGPTLAGGDKAMGGGRSPGKKMRPQCCGGAGLRNGVRNAAAGSFARGWAF